MGFREPLDLEEIIGSNDFAADALGYDDRPAARGLQRHAISDEVIFLVPRSIGSGAKVCSTSVALEPWPSIVFDVNGYYRALGVGFRATRRELMDAYMARGGQSDEYLTYVLKQLLNPAVRREYDAQPSGCRYMDRYLIDELKRRAILAAVEVRKKGGTATASSVLSDWGFTVEDAVFDDPEGAAQEVAEVDIPQDMGEDDLDQPVSSRWMYSYYMWRFSAMESTGRIVFGMPAWQQAIIAKANERGWRLNFAVGAMGRKEISRVAVLSVDGTTVMLIRSEEIGPDGSIENIDELASDVLDRLIYAGIN